MVFGMCGFISLQGLESCCAFLFLLFFYKEINGIATSFGWRDGSGHQSFYMAWVFGPRLHDIKHWKKGKTICLLPTT